MILLAGLGLSGRYMLPVGAELAERFEVWVPDLPSHGRRDGPPTSLDMHELADVVVAWMDEIGMRTAVLVGNSMGCQVAVEAAVRHPDRVSGVVLEGPTIDAGCRSVLVHVWRIALDGTREPPSLTPLQAGEWFGTGPVRLCHAIRYAFSHEVERRLPLVGCPALVVRGGRDPIVSHRWAEQVTASLPDAELVTVPAGAHAMTYSRPEVLAGLVVDFVAQIARDRRRPGADPPRPRRT